MSNLIRVFLLMYCVVSVQAFGLHVVLSGSVSVPAAFTASATASELSICPQGQNKFQFWNGTSTAIELGLGAKAGAVPTEVFATAPANTMVDFEGYITFNGVKPVFARALGSSPITSGTITMLCPGIK